jgi:hypothetical protein
MPAAPATRGVGGRSLGQLEGHGRVGDESAPGELSQTDTPINEIGKVDKLITMPLVSGLQ